MLFARYVERLTEMVRWHIAPSLQKRMDPEDPVHSAYRSFFVRARQGSFVIERSGDLWKLLVTITLNKLRRQIVYHRAQKRTVAKEVSLQSSSQHVLDLADGPSPLLAIAAADELQAFMAKLTEPQRRVLETAPARKALGRDCRRKLAVQNAPFAACLKKIRHVWESQVERTYEASK